eukprot:gene9408-11145_t
MSKENIDANMSCREPDSISFDVIDGPEHLAGLAFTKQAKKYTIGRTKANNIPLKVDDISSKHAEITWDGDNWIVIDKHSSNGTSVGCVLESGEFSGRQLEAGQGCVIDNGTIIKFGTQTLVRVTSRLDDSLSVAQYLQAECERLAREVGGKADILCANLRENSARMKKELLELK